MSAVSLVSASPIQGNETIITREVSSPLIEIFQTEDNIHKAARLINRDDYLNKDEGLKKLLGYCLKNDAGELQEVTEALIEKAPVRAILNLMLRQENADNYRQLAVEAYQKQHPEDKNFESGLFFTNDVNLVLAHLLIQEGYLESPRTSEGKPINSDYYADKMAGFVFGSINYDRTEVIPAAEAEKVKAILGAEKFAQVTTPTGEGFLVTTWFSLPSATDDLKRYETLFPESVKAIHSKVFKEFDQLFKLKVN